MMTWNVLTAALNGTGLINDPFGTIFSPFTDFFEAILGPGGGNVFFLIPVLVLAAGLWFKNPNKPIMPVVFLIGSSALLGLGNVFAHAYGAAVVCLVLTGLGFTGLIMNTVFQKGG
jgi:hypothetical protein